MGASKFVKFAVAALSLGGVLAHPDLSNEEMAEYQHNVARNTEVLGRCLESPDMKALHTRMLEQRSATLQHLRKARGIELDTGEHPSETSDILPRDKPSLDKWIKVNHEHPGQSRDPQDIFHFHWNEKPASNPAGCILTPESIYGPYWIDGQLRRQDIRAGQQGIYLRLAMQVIDLNTCKPLQDARVDTWHANSLGQYSTTNTSFLRGWQPTSPYGTVDFDTIFPGHYPGRASHIHVVVRPSNQERVVHTGMLYFDERVRQWVETTEHYRANKVPVVLNKDDLFAPYAASDRYDPFVQWAWMGRRISDGVLAWITMGVNLTDPNIEQPHKKRSLFDDHLDH